MSIKKAAGEGQEAEPWARSGYHQAGYPECK